MRKDLVLEIDAGNSAVKWRLVSDHVDQPCARANYLEVFNELSSMLSGNHCVSFTRVVSVAGVAFDNKLEALLKEHSIDIGVARVQSEVAGVRCGYEDTSQLGVDRWMAVLAAAHAYSGSKLVVDIGSALTIDFIDDGHNHLGGYIVPGWGLMQLALENGTQINHDRIPKDYSTSDIKPGKSTLDAIGMGRIKLMTSIIESAYSDFLRQQQGSEVVLVCTGGDAQKIKPHLSISNVQYVENLVLDGLSIAVPAGKQRHK